MTHDDLSRLVMLLGRYWPHAKAPSADDIEAWESLLLHLDPLLCAAAIQTLAADGREWPPPPGLIQRRTRDLTTNLPDKGEAWNEIDREVKRIGSTRGMEDWHTGQVRQPKWSHPLVGHVCDQIGWDRLCQSTKSEIDRAHFFRLWDEAREHQRMLEQLPPASRDALQAAGVQLPDMSLQRALDA